MTLPAGQSLNLRRALVGVVVGATAAVVILGALTAGFLVSRWALVGADDFDRRYDLRLAREWMVMPAIGCVVVAGSAGWAACAPARRHRFARSLALVFLGSLLPWWLATSLVQRPRPLKGDDPTRIQPSDVLLAVGPPVLAAGVLTVCRIRGPVDAGG